MMLVRFALQDLPTGSQHAVSAVTPQRAIIINIDSAGSVAILQMNQQGYTIHVIHL
jgi:hypothetical protein